MSCDFPTFGGAALFDDPEPLHLRRGNSAKLRFAETGTTVA
jgi:hypothetical protein